MLLPLVWRSMGPKQSVEGLQFRAVVANIGLLEGCLLPDAHMIQHDADGIAHFDQPFVCEFMESNAHQSGIAQPTTEYRHATSQALPDSDISVRVRHCLTSDFHITKQFFHDPWAIKNPFTLVFLSAAIYST